MEARKKNDYMEGLVDSFQDGMTEGDGNTALSSILPIVNPAQVRAKAPRASLPRHNNGSSDSLLEGVGPRSKSHPKKNEDKPKELDEYTVETNRPIDSVYIYPSAPQSVSNHRQRRQYRSGLRSITGGSTSGSSVGSGVGNSSSHVSGGTGSVGGILESLGLGHDVNGRAGSIDQESSRMHDESLFKSTVASNNSSTGMSYPPPRRHHHRGGARLRHQGGSGSGVHTRAALILFGMMAMLYVSFQSLAMAKVNRQNQLQAARAGSRKNTRHKTRSYRAFEEGEDRPMPKDILGKIKDPSSNTAKASGSTTTKTTTRSTTSTNDKPLYVEKPEIPDLSKEETKGDAAGDSLEEIDKQEQAEATALSLAVQSGLSNIYTKDSAHKDIPFLWYIPRSGGGMVKNILSNCMELTVASEVGATAAKNPGDPKLEVITVASHRYVNVDTTTEQGIAEAKALGLASSRLANLIVSPRFQEGASLFSTSNKGRGFTMLRHPVERAVSMFYFLKKHNVPAVATMELEEYCKSPHVENNWMTRILSDQMSGDVTDTQLEIAKKALKEKLVIGLLEQKEESMRRFEYYFGWHYDDNSSSRQNACRTRILVGDYRTNESAKGKVKEGSQAWSLLMWQNKFDMQLYRYAKALFLQQGAELFADMGA